MEIIIILLLIIISILSIGAKTTFIIIGFIIVGFVLWIVIGHTLQNREIEEEKRRENKKKYDTQRAAYLNGEISEDEFEYMPKTEASKRELRALKDKLYRANHPETESDL